MAGVSHVLVLSLGNPAPYLNTFHSAGHIALEVLRRELSLPPFAKSKLFGGKSALTTKTTTPIAATDGGNDMHYTLMQSPTLMNVSGPWVARVWRDALKAQGDDSSTVARIAEDGSPVSPISQLGLILVHDDLEEAVGVLKMRPWTRSHRGHNGLKSTNNSLQRGAFPDARWAKLSVGIGRPETRDKSSVADFVLRNMTTDERAALEDGLGSGLLAAIRRIEERWAAGKETEEAPVKPPKPPKQPRTRPVTRPAPAA